MPVFWGGSPATPIRSFRSEVMLTMGPAAEMICEEARKTEADLLVIGRGADAGVLGRLTSHAYSIIQIGSDADHGAGRRDDLRGSPQDGGGPAGDRPRRGCRCSGAAHQPRLFDHSDRK